MSDSLISPHGGVLVDLVVDDARAEELKNESRDWASWDLTERQLCDIELLMNGAFSPLTGFLAKADYESVCDNMRLADGTLWPMPIMLDVTAEVAEGLESGSKLALRDPEGVMLAVIHVEDVWEADRAAEAEKVFGSTNPEHPGVDFLMTQTQNASYMQQLTPAQLEVFSQFPLWLAALWGVAVLGGFLGAVLLLMRKRIAMPVLLVSVLAMTATALHNAFFANGLYSTGGTGPAFVLLIFAIALGLWLYALVMGKRGALV